MRLINSLFVLSLIGLLVACSTQPGVTPAAEAELNFQVELAQAKEAEALERLDAQEARILNQSGYEDMNRRLVVLVAGSVDGLQAAINTAGPWGKVIVAAGLHIENQTIHVNHPVRIIGQNGAIIQSNVVPTSDGSFATIPTQATPSIWVKGANFVRIQNLTILPDPATGYGDIAFAIEEADFAYLKNNKVEDFGCGIGVVKSDFVLIRDNDVNGTLSEGAPIATNSGILLASGRFAGIRGNHAEDCLYNFFASDQNGIMYDNSSDAGVFNYILCTYAPGFISYPNGTPLAADLSCKQWLTIRNTSTNALNTSYFVIDGSNENVLVSNDTQNAGIYEFWFVGDFPDPLLGTLPTSFNNVYIAGAYPNQSVKDCGRNNTIFGGVLVDTTVDPCP